MLIGVALTWGGSQAIAWTNTESFCISCHEMRENVYAEYKETVHDQNRTGVRATCADCHVPYETLPKLLRKARASMELYGHFTGVIDTPEKFESQRYVLAKKVWTEMRRSDSRTCRHCHTESAMADWAQTEKAVEKHAEAKKAGQTCIDCHFGIAHTEPNGELTPATLGVAIER